MGTQSESNVTAVNKAIVTMSPFTKNSANAAATPSSLGFADRRYASREGAGSGAGKTVTQPATAFSRRANGPPRGQPGPEPLTFRSRRAKATAVKRTTAPTAPTA